MADAVFTFWRVVLVLAALFFLLFGIYLLILAYYLKDPFSFVLTFFSSNLIILISAVFLIGALFRKGALIRKISGHKEPEETGS
jgi:di/tricarboxylate transporter